MNDRQRQFARRMRAQPTDAERILWQRLRHDIALTGSHFRRQALIGPFIVDFVSRRAKLVIELDGGQHDVVVAGVRAQPDGSVVVDGSVPIRDLNRAMEWHLPDEEATTIAGLVIHEARSIPDRGQSFTFHGFRFRVLRRERNRITALRIVPLPRESDAPEKKPKAGTSF